SEHSIAKTESASRRAFGTWSWTKIRLRLKLRDSYLKSPRVVFKQSVNLTKLNPAASPHGARVTPSSEWTSRLPQLTDSPPVPTPTGDALLRVPTPHRSEAAARFSGVIDRGEGLTGSRLRGGAAEGSTRKCRGTFSRDRFLVLAETGCRRDLQERRSE
ncbi:hypothetical protein AVEN_259318-1, partial [Araneus ventricosus]